jgi:hypothetical protein
MRGYRIDRIYFPAEVAGKMSSLAIEHLADAQAGTQ